MRPLVVCLGLEEQTSISEEERPKNEPSALQNLTLPIFPKEVGGKVMAPQRLYDAPAFRIIFTHLVLIHYTNVSSAFRLLLVMLPPKERPAVFSPKPDFHPGEAKGLSL